MRMKSKFILSAITALFLVLLSACAPQTNPYIANDDDNYTVSVKYDANGGVFTTNAFVIVDSYDINQIQGSNTNEAEIALLSPDNPARGNDAFTATKSGCFLAGWYKECVETIDADGNKTYSYSGRWDFEKDVLTLDKTKEYTSQEPVLTLYAAWVPLFEIEFYSLDTGEYVDSMKFDPTVKSQFELPFWDEETGSIEMNDFPVRPGYTFNKAFLDAEGTKELKGESFEHNGTIDYDSGVANDSVMKLYVDYTEGEWYRIYTAEQFVESANLSGNYEILADLDFSDEIWPTSFMYGNYSGTIKGNGHTIRNVEITQTNNSKVNAGLFGYLTETANISDLKVENVTFTIKSGTRVVGTSYGLFAGTVSTDAQISKVDILKSTLQIDSSCYFGVDDYTIGLACGMGDSNLFSSVDVKTAVVGDKPDSIRINTNGNAVTLDFIND